MTVPNLEKIDAFGGLAALASGSKAASYDASLFVDLKGTFVGVHAFPRRRKTFGTARANSEADYASTGGYLDANLARVNHGVATADAKNAVSARIRKIARTLAHHARESNASAAPSDRDVPDVIFDDSAIPILSGHVTVVLYRFLTLLNLTARQKRIDIPTVEVRGTVDPEDGTAQLLVKAWVRGLSESESRKFYYDFGGVVDAWSANLPIELRAIFATTISLQVRRVQDA